MANHLRPIALTVNEPSPGLFHWALLQSNDTSRVFDHRFVMAEEPYDSFEKAARAGMLNWLRLAGDDTKRGPRIVDKRTPLVPELLAAERVVLQNASLAPDVALLRLGVSTPDGDLLVVADLRPDRLLRIFGRSNLFRSYLVDVKGEVLVHPDPEQVLSHADFSKVPVVRDALSTKVTRGATEFDGMEFGMMVRI